MQDLAALRLCERWFTQIFCSRKGAEDAKNSYGMQGLAGLAAWRETLMIKREDLFSRKGAKNAKDSYGMQDLADLAAWREFLMIHARGFIFSQRRKGRKGIPTECWTWRTWRLGESF
jgi:hypothetical protein